MARGLVALLDDMAQLLDDVAAMTKIAATKTAGVVGDDVALNAQMLLGMASRREIPIIWEVAKKSLLNKAILIPCALGISAVAPGAIAPILMLGGTYLCYEGVEKVIHKLFHGKHDDQEAEQHAQELLRKSPDEVAAHYAANEKKIIKGAAMTDLILSAEIVAIALGSMAAAPLAAQAGALTLIGAAMTAGVYGAAAAVVKLDDAGLWLAAREGAGKVMDGVRVLGRGVVNTAPYLMKTLSFVGTAAMFLVGGGILMHGIPGAEALIHHVAHAAHSLPYIGAIAEAAVPSLGALLGGVVAGAVALGVVTPVAKGVTALRQKFFPGARPAAGPDVGVAAAQPIPAAPLPEAKAAPAAQKTLIDSVRPALNGAADPVQGNDDKAPAAPSARPPEPPMPG